MSEKEFATNLIDLKTYGNTIKFLDFSEQMFIIKKKKKTGISKLLL